MFNCKCCVNCGKQLNSKIPYCAICDEDMEYIESLFDPYELEKVGQFLIWESSVRHGSQFELTGFEHLPGRQIA